MLLAPDTVETFSDRTPSQTFSSEDNLIPLVVPLFQQCKQR